MENKNPLQTIFIYGIFAVFFILLICMLYPYATVFLWTALLYVLIRPLYQKSVSHLNKEKKFYNGKRHILGGAFAIGTFILIIVPLTFLVISLTQQLISVLSDASKYIEQNPDFITNNILIMKLEDFSERTGFDIPQFDLNTLPKTILGFINTYSTRVFYLGKSIASSLGSFILSMLFIIFSLYFCFIDGPYLLSVISLAIPIKAEYMKLITSKFSQTTRSLFSGYILVALYQGIVAFILMSIFHVKGSLLFSALLMLASFIPMFGAAIVWLPIGIVLCFTSSVVKGVLFLILSGICISFLDNFLRPLFLKDRIHVHPLIIFFAILGGINFFGLNGLIVGPLIVIIFFTLLDILSKKSETEQLEKSTTLVKTEESQQEKDKEK